MSLAVAGRAVHRATDLTERSQLALAFIEDGVEWIDWAAQPHARSLQFADETQLLAAVQQGLHVSPYALLPRLALLVSPVKLLTLNVEDLRTLAAVEGGDASGATRERARAVLAAHHLLTQRELTAGMEFVAQLGVSDAPLFQAADLDARLSLAALASLPEVAAHTEYLQHEAAAFALDAARTVQEFCDTFRLYLDCTERLASHAAAHAGARREAAQAALHQLRPVLYAALFCPQVAELPAPSEVGHVVRDWIASGHALGFARLTRAVQQIVRHTDYRNEHGEQARRLVERYLAEASAFLAHVHVEHGVLGQDGATCAYEIVRDGHRAVLQLGADRVVSLATFHRIGAEE